MKRKLLALVTLMLCAVTGAWADDTDLIVSWNTAPTLSNNSDDCSPTGTKNNVATWSDGTTIKIMRSDKDMANGGDITIGGNTYKSIKVSNGAQNKLTMPSGKLAYSVTIYSYVNADSGDAYWSEVNGDKSQTTAMTSFRDGDNPDKRTYNLGGVSSFTFTNAGKQLCYVLVISTVSKQEATLEFAQSSGSADIANGTSFTLPKLTKNPTSLEVAYSSSNENVAEINATTGAVTLKGIGTTTITASFSGDDNYYAASAEYELTVTNSAVANITVTYAIEGITGIEGTAPASFNINEGEKFKIPANQTLYMDGSTLTGWKVGETVYKIGDEVTAPATNLTLIPDFTTNASEAYLGHIESTVTWNFKKSTGAPLWDQLQGNGATTIYVTQAAVGASTIDVKMVMDATNGKIDNSSNDNWTQMNTGTKLTVPVVVGSTLELKVYKEGTTPVTFDGVDGDFASNIYSYTATAAGDLEIVFGENDQSYAEYLTVTYPSESAVLECTSMNTQVVLTKENILNNDYLSVNPTDKWNTGKNYADIQGDFFNMSNGRTLTLNVKGASTFELYVQNINSDDRTYTVKVGDEDAVAITHNEGGTVAQGLFEIADPTVVTTITVAGTGKSVYPVYFMFNPGQELTTTHNMAGWKSFYDADNDYTLDENTTAYVATEVVQDETEQYVVELTPIDCVPSDMAVLLKTTNQRTDDGTYSLTLTKAKSVTRPNIANKLKPSHEADYDDVYRLGFNADDGVAFFPYTRDITAEPDVVVLNYDSSSSAGARQLTIRISDGSETTGIKTIDNGQLTMDNDVWYDLQGRRVTQPSKGLYIVNGKKVIIK